LFLVFSCNTKKESALGKGMHNLTSRYNYLYHANLILDDYESQQRDSYATNYQELLPTYISVDSLQSTATELDKVIEKAKTIIAEKSNTKYMADAYLLLAKANFLKGNYFLSQAYYEYVVQAFPENLNAQVYGLDGQARSLLQLGNYKLAKTILNKLSFSLVSVKKGKAEPLATLAQANIITHDFTAAISYLEASLKEGGKKHDQLRRTYILGQLEEQQKNYPKALYYYLKVQKSNAPFDLYFNSILNQVKISAHQTQGIDKKQAILALIKEDKNTAYADQLYYELAQTHAEELNFNQALGTFQLALNINTTNNYQKGLIYQQMALINAKHFKKYTQARVYYDNSLKAFPKSYAGYEQVALQHKNMQYLSSRYEIIALQDSLQRVASLPEAERQRLQHTQTTIAPITSSTPVDPDGAASQTINKSLETKASPIELPLTPTLIAASNHQIREAYQQLGSFYAQEMGDQEEAVNIFEIMASRFPNSVYAQTQLNAEWRSKKAEMERKQLQKYNEVYQAYESKNYQQVIEVVDQLSLSSEVSNTLAPQFLYLRALATGRTATVEELLRAFNTISQQYPNDVLVSPLVRSHLSFIKQHLPAFQKRKIALIDTDPDEPPFIKEPVVEIHKPTVLAEKAPKTPLPTPVEPSAIFSKATAATYYFVIQVADASITLSSSRFGIGQFNRGNYADSGLKHQLTEIDNEQLIYIGNFTNFADVKTYAEGIRPQLKQIMKVRESEYTSFIISQKNFDKITSEALLKEYIEFYKNNY
jgi:tetratricopeptide (TPR) repeat protein